MRLGVPLQKVILKSPYVGVKQKLLRGGLSLVSLFSRNLSTFYKISLCGCETKIVMRAMVTRDFRGMKLTPLQTPHRKTT